MNCADSKDGDHIDDPSEDALFMLIDDLIDSDNTFVVIQPDEEDPAWFTSVAVQDDGGFEVGRRDTVRREHEVTTDTDISRIARDVTIWMAARDFPESLTSPTGLTRPSPSAGPPGPSGAGGTGRLACEAGVRAGCGR